MTSFPASTTSSTVIWVFDDVHDIRRNALDQLLPQASIRSFAIGQFTTQTKLQQLQLDMLQQGPALLWIHIAGVPTGLDYRAQTRLRSIVSLATFQMLRRRHIAVEIPGKTAASQFVIDHLPKESTTTQIIPHCNLGIVHPQSTRPSAAKTTLITTANIVCPTECKCGKAPSDHVREDSKGAGIAPLQAQDYARSICSSIGMYASRWLYW